MCFEHYKCKQFVEQHYSQKLFSLFLNCLRGLRGVLITGTTNISATNMLIFTVMVISRDNQRSRFSASKISFYLMHAKERIATKLPDNCAEWFLYYFIVFITIYIQYVTVKN